MVALLALERAYAGMGDRNGDGSLCAYLLSSFVTRYNGLAEKLELVLVELANIEGGKGASALLNIDTARKIFEDEDPNSYKESLLACHLAASTLITRKPPLQSQAGECANPKVIGMTLLQILHEQYCRSDPLSIMNDVTRQNALFPDIHGLLVACSVVVYLGGIDSHCLQEQARMVVSVCGITMHPSIYEALGVLMTAKPGEESTRDGLSQLCFLLPGVVA